MCIIYSGAEGTGLAARGLLEFAPAACVCCFPYECALIYQGNPKLKLPPSAASAAPIIRLTLKNRCY